MVIQHAPDTVANCPERGQLAVHSYRPAFQQTTLTSQLGAVEIITHCLFRSPLQELTFTEAHSSSNH